MNPMHGQNRLSCLRNTVSKNSNFALLWELGMGSGASERILGRAVSEVGAHYQDDKAR